VHRDAFIRADPEAGVESRRCATALWAASPEKIKDYEGNDQRDQPEISEERANAIQSAV
jgi:hypothetical protein